MTATHSIAPTLLVAIDISKHRHEVLIGIPGKKRRRRITITNTLDDFQRLSAVLASYDMPVRIGFEATGNYHRTLAHHLGRAGFELKLVSSVGLARTREALHNSWDKNDPKDAQVILHMLEIGAVQFFHDPIMVGTADIQELSKTHEIVSRSKTELWHRILTLSRAAAARPLSPSSMYFRNRVRSADGKGADMVHPPEQDESHRVTHGNPHDSRFSRKALSPNS